MGLFNVISHLGGEKLIRKGQAVKAAAKVVQNANFIHDLLAKAARLSQEVPFKGDFFQIRERAEPRNGRAAVNSGANIITAGCLEIAVTIKQQLEQPSGRGVLK